MKKLFIFALAVIMVLSLAAVSMAATTVGGKLQFYYNSTAKTTFSNATVSFDAAVNDNIGAFAEVTTDPTKVGAFGFGDYYATVKFDAGTLKVGSYQYKFFGDTDVLAFNTACPLIKGDATVEFAPELGEGISASVLYNLAAGVPSGLAEGAYGLKVGYQTDAFGVELGMANQDTNNNMTIVNASYSLDALKLFVNYETGKVAGVDAQDQIIGVAYTADALFGRVEYDMSQTTNNNLGVALGYSKDGVTYSIIHTSIGGADTDGLKMKVVF